MAKDLIRSRRYINKFHQMRTQLQAIGLRIQTLRSNEQMADAMRGATRAMASMNRGLNLPVIQRIMNEFERESSTMDMKEEIISDTVDDVMDEEEDEEEGDKVLKEVLDEIGVNVSQQLVDTPTGIATLSSPLTNRTPVALGEATIPTSVTRANQEQKIPPNVSDEETLQARLDALRRG
ncbi:hypothetical protein AX15_003411 [Amanita polypyramis BW_CC]|nr:hypothetical protein AX15_003411 [Amanita polypyramis BW_CC]